MQHDPSHALADLLGAVADEARWGQALHRYAASFDGGLLGGAVLAGGVSQLARWESEFAAHPHVDYWLRSPPGDGAPALVVMGVEAEAAQHYDRHYRLQDPLWDAMMRRERTGGLGSEGAGAWVVSDAPTQAAHGFRRTGIYSDFFRPRGIGARMIGAGGGAPHLGSRLFMWVYRPDDQRDGEGFAHEEVARFEAELRAVQRAACLHREMLALRERTQGLEALMERLPLGLLFFDTAGRLLHANARARKLAARPAHGALRALLRAPVLAGGADARLRALFQQSLRGLSGCAELPGGLLLVTLAIGDLAALGLGHAAPGVAWVVMERGLDSGAAVALARQAYRLSPSETELLLALMRGQTPRDFADARGSRISTVRTHMRALLAKTRTQRQQDLVALVARLMLLTPAQVGGALHNGPPFS